MSENSGSVSNTNSQPNTLDVLSVFDANDVTAMSTQTVAEKLNVTEDAVREVLEATAEEGELVKVDLEGEYVGWERNRDEFVGRRDGNSYCIRDGKTGLVTRGSTRSAALRRIADRIDQFENGDHVGAQILGIADAAISPTYFEDVGDVIDSLIRPDYTTLYAYVEGDGVTEIQTEAQLNRSQRIKGFTVTAVMDLETFDRDMLIPVDDLLERTPLEKDHFPVGVFKVTAVPPEYQQQGIGSSLISHGMAYLAETPPVISLLWEREDESNERIADNVGAERLTSYEKTTPLDEKCPECGFEGGCDCSTVVYAWGLDKA